MALFCKGEQVVIRYGLQQDLKATILRSRRLDTYLVKVEDGTVRFYSGKGLAKENGGAQKVVTSAAASPARRISNLRRAKVARPI